MNVFDSDRSEDGPPFLLTVTRLLEIPSRCAIESQTITCPCWRPAIQRIIGSRARPCCSLFDQYAKQIAQATVGAVQGEERYEGFGGSGAARASPPQRTRPYL